MKLHSIYGRILRGDLITCGKFFTQLRVLICFIWFVRDFRTRGHSYKLTIQVCRTELLRRHFVSDSLEFLAGWSCWERIFDHIIEWTDQNIDWEIVWVSVVSVCRIIGPSWYIYHSFFFLFSYSSAQCSLSTDLFIFLIYKLFFWVIVISLIICLMNFIIIIQIHAFNAPFILSIVILYF